MEDAFSVEEILNAATDELRLVYTPNKTTGSSTEEPAIAEKFVAIDDSSQLLGVAEYIRKLNKFYIQGIAVRSPMRKQGVAQGLISYICEIARGQGVSSIELKTIEETGNCKIFERIGFSVISRTRSDKFLDVQGQPVTEVVMGRDVF